MEERTLEERILALELEVARMKAELLKDTETPPVPWWKSIIGIYKDCPEFEEMVRYGREWRASEWPEYGDEETSQKE